MEVVSFSVKTYGRNADFNILLGDGLIDSLDLNIDDLDLIMPVNEIVEDIAQYLVYPLIPTVHPVDQDSLNAAMDVIGEWIEGNRLL